MTIWSRGRSSGSIFPAISVSDPGMPDRVCALSHHPASPVAANSAQARGCCFRLRLIRVLVLDVIPDRVGISVHIWVILVGPVGRRLPQDTYRDWPSHDRPP